VRIHHLVADLEQADLPVSIDVSHQATGEG